VLFAVPPRIDSSAIDLNVSVVVNRTAVLNCPVDGYPTPEIWWLKNGELLDTSRSGVELLQGGRQLRIHHSQVPSSVPETIFLRRGTFREAFFFLNIILFAEEVYLTYAARRCARLKKR